MHWCHHTSVLPGVNTFEADPLILGLALQILEVATCTFFSLCHDVLDERPYCFHEWVHMVCSIAEAGAVCQSNIDGIGRT